MRCIVFIMIASLAGTLLAQDVDRPQSAAGDSINRGLDFLVKDAVRWKNDHQCVSCHHASNVISVLTEAKRRNLVVDDSMLAELTKWVAEAGDGKTGVPRPATAPRALNTKALYFAIGLAADPSPDGLAAEGLKRMVNTIKGDQLEDGSWSAWPETRPPYFGSSDESMTILATLAVTNAAESGDELAKAVRDKGIKWLMEHKTDGDPQSIAMRLVLWQRLGRPAEELDPLVQRIKRSQNEDGGWSQTREMASDAWATGQALYALAQAGVKSSDPVISRARNFLIQTQREDGSWPMTSRPTIPGGPGSTSLIPIIGGGSGWALMGLIRSF